MIRKNPYLRFKELPKRIDLMQELPRKNRGIKKKVAKILSKARTQTKPEYLLVQVPGGGNLRSYLDQADRILSNIATLDDPGLLNLERLASKLESIITGMNLRDNLIELSTRKRSQKNGNKFERDLLEYQRMIDYQQKVTDSQISELRAISMGDMQENSSIPSSRLQEGRTIDIGKIGLQLTNAGFKGVEFSSDFHGMRFQLVAKGKRREARQTVWTYPTILIKTVKTFDTESARELARDFSSIYRQIMKPIAGECFLYCVIADTAQPDAEILFLKMVQKEKSKLRYLAIDSGDGDFIIASVSKKEIFPPNRIEIYAPRKDHSDFGKAIEIIRDSL